MQLEMVCGQETLWDFNWNWIAKWKLVELDCGRDLQLGIANWQFAANRKFARSLFGNCWQIVYVLSGSSCRTLSCLLFSCHSHVLSSLVTSCHGDKTADKGCVYVRQKATIGILAVFNRTSVYCYFASVFLFPLSSHLCRSSERIARSRASSATPSTIQCPGGPPKEDSWALSHTNLFGRRDIMMSI